MTQLTLADIARLAHVQRAVPSMWRRRELPGQPFPRPVVDAAGRQRFDADEVAAYLSATGRGNNPEVTEDLAAHGSTEPPGDLDSAATFDGLTALLCLMITTGATMGSLGTAELRSAVHAADPEDGFLRREILALGEHGPQLAQLADDLADASFSAVEAFDHLMTQPSTQPGINQIELGPSALNLTAGIARAIADEAGWSSPVLVDVTDGTADLLLEVIRTYADDIPPSVATRDLDTRMSRLTRRRLRLHDVHRLAVALDDRGDLALPPVANGTVHVLQLPPASNPGTTDRDILTFLDDLVIQLADSSRLVVVAPASALVDRTRSAEAELARDSILRSGRLRAAVRLPPGLVIRSPRQPLALLVFGPAHSDVSIADRWTVVGDVSDRVVDAALTEALVTDVVAAMTSGRTAHGHSFLVTRQVSTSTLIARRSVLAPAPHAARRPVAPETLAQAIDRAARELTPSRLSAIRARARGTSTAANITTLGAAITARLCRAVPGTRVRPEDIMGAGRPLIGPAELIGELSVGTRAVDPLTFPTDYPTARYTEPGDVVFCTSPRIAALVDGVGGRVVITPARVIRVVEHRHGTALHPEVLVADLQDAAKSNTKDWRRWPVRMLPAQHIDALSAVLSPVTDERIAAAETLARLDRLTRTLIDGAVSGAVDIDIPTDRPSSTGSLTDEAGH